MPDPTPTPTRIHATTGRATGTMTIDPGTAMPEIDRLLAEMRVLCVERVEREKPAPVRKVTVALG